MSERLILVLDEGTTSTRAMLFTPAGELRGTAQRELTQHYPQPGWVEHDAAEIWERTLACAQEMVAAAGGAEHRLAGSPHRRLLRRLARRGPRRRRA